MRTLPNLRTSTIAIIAILALLLVPACSSLCTAMNHCSSGTASAESDACHHANVSAHSDSETLSSSTSCNQPAPLLAILAASDSLLLKSVFAADASFSIDISVRASTLANRFHEFQSLRESPQESIPLENLSILRI
jgi:hypothetical protein